MKLFNTFFKDFQPFFIILYLGLMGMFCVLSVQLYFGKTPDVSICLISTGIIFSIYIFNRFTDIKEDFANNINKYLFFSKRKIIYKIGLASIILVFVSLVAMEKLRLFHLILVSLGVFYSYRLIPWYKKDKGVVYFRLKELPLVKNIVVSLLWGTAIFAVPILFTNAQVNNFSHVYILVAVIFVSTLNNTIWGDIRDKAGDQIANNVTLPVLIGVRNTYLFIGFVNVFWLLFITGIFLFQRINIYHFIFLLVMACYPITYILAYHISRLSRTTVDFISESDLLVFAGGLALLSIV